MFSLQNDDASKDKEKDKKEKASPKKTTKVKMIDLPVEAQVPQLSGDQLHSYIEKEVSTGGG